MQHNKIESFIENLKKVWSGNTVKSYPYINQLFEYVELFKKLCVGATGRGQSKLNSVVYVSTSNIHRLFVELLHGFIVGQRITLRTLNRSLNENLIILSFLIKYGNDSADLFNANGEVSYNKMIKDLLVFSNQPVGPSILKSIKESGSKYSDVKLADGYKWANRFLGYKRNQYSTLKDLAENTNMMLHYNNIRLLNEQTHSSSSLAHYLNIDTHNDYAVNASLLMMAVNVLKCVVEILKIDNNEDYDRFRLLNIEITTLFDKLTEKPKANPKVEKE